MEYRILARAKTKIHMVTSIDAEKSFGKIQHSFMIKKIDEIWNGKNVPKHNKDHI
jgi:hypothetical protein